MDAGLFIYFPRDPGHNIYFKVFDHKDIYFEKLPPPPRINFTSPKKKGTSFNHSKNSTDCHTKHIAMLHGLLPSDFNVGPTSGCYLDYLL